MSTTIVGRNGRVYTRRFDYEETRRRLAAGESAKALAREYGVSVSTIQRARDPERWDAWGREHQRSGICPSCGGPASQNRARPQGLCLSCRTKARATSVREKKLLCFGCRRWKPDDEFPHNRANRARRNRHSFCRACGTKRRRDYRERTKVPCSGGCGKLVLPPSEKGPNSSPLPRCRSCSNRAAAAERRERDLSHERHHARRRANA